MEQEMANKAVLEIEHAIGISCLYRNVLKSHPNGKEYVYICGGCVVIQDKGDAHKQDFLRCHDDDVVCVDLSPSGRFIASGQIGTNADVCVSDFDTRKLLFRLNEHDFGVALCKFSRDEKLLLTVGDVRDNRIIVWDMANGYVVVSDFLDKQLKRSYVDQTATKKQCVASWGGKQRDIKKRETRNYQFSISKDNSLLLFILDPFKGRIERSSLDCKARIRNFTYLVFNEMGDRLFAGTESGDVILFNVKTRQNICSLKCCSRDVTNIFLIEDPRKPRIVVSGGDGTVTEFERVLSSRNYYQHQERLIPLKKIEFGSSEIHSFHAIMNKETFQPDRLVVGSTSGEVYNLDYDSFKAECFSQSHSNAVTCVTFKNNISDQFATCSYDRTMCLWDSSSYRMLSESNFRVKQGVYPLAMSFVQDILLSGWNDGSVRAVDSVTGEILWKREECHRGQIHSLVSGKNCKFFLTGGEEGDVKVWSVKGMNLVSNLKNHRSVVTDICLFDDDVHFLSSSKDKYILCWDLRKEKSVGTYYNKMGYVQGISLRANQNHFVSIGGKVVAIWDIRQPKPTQVLLYSKTNNRVTTNNTKKEYEGTTIDFLPSGKFFATGGTDEVVNLYDFDTKRVLATGKGHSGTIRKVKFSPDEKQMVSVGNDGMVILWNLFQF